MANRVIYNDTDVNAAKTILINAKSLVSTASSDISNFVSSASSMSANWDSKAKEYSSFDIINQGVFLFLKIIV